MHYKEDCSEGESAAVETEPVPEDPGIHLNYDWSLDAVIIEEASHCVCELSTPAVLPYINGAFAAVGNEYFGLQMPKDYVHVGNYEGYRTKRVSD